MAGEAQLVFLNVGDKVDKYTVTSKLGEGTFGAVYKVKGCGGQDGALKTEHESVKLLALERNVMLGLKQINSQYCCLLLDSGRHDNFVYIVMDLVGQCLQDVKKMGPDKHMSPGVALSVSVQTLEGLRELHSAGFMHRDVKPGNYATGLREKDGLRRIYLLDFGMCKPWQREGEGQVPGKFRGTPRYAPLASHKKMEHCRREDLESWFYMLIDFCNAALPWKVTQNLDEIASIKEDCRKQPKLDEMMKGVPPEMMNILKHIDELKFYDPPDYPYLEFPYDWEPAECVPMSASSSLPPRLSIMTKPKSVLSKSKMGGKSRKG